MTKDLAAIYRAWRKYRDIHDALTRLSNRDLADIGVKRGDIPTIARKSAGF
ncbi:MAG TPA: DUF1127 domain-containing protein [Bauldia sp.]|jgi:uncharacterized protein YjiS (DUF1127 family)